MGLVRSARVLLGALLLTVVVVFLSRNASTPEVSILASPSRPKIPSRSKQVDLDDRIVVVASTKAQDTSWINDELPEYDQVPIGAICLTAPSWPRAVYVVDDSMAPFHTDVNKGNEGNVYLNYIITNYDHLPASMIFVHYHNTAVHIDRALGTNAESIKRLNLSHVQNQGYVSLRCAIEPGCICAPMRFWSRREENYERAWTELFPGERCPEMVLAPCCAQFAVSREQVLARPLSDYQRYLKWLHNTDMPTYISGRIMEYLWHIIFGRDPVHCPDEDRCYCETYGLCEPDPKRGFQPEELSWLNGHKCAKYPPNS